MQLSHSHILSLASNPWVTAHPLSPHWTSPGFLGFEKSFCFILDNSMYVLALQIGYCPKKMSVLWGSHNSSNF